MRDAMVSIGASMVLVACSGGQAGASQEPPPSSRPASASSSAAAPGPEPERDPDTASLGFPHLVLRVENFAADEGEDWSYAIARDGRFVGGGSMSNGGAERTVWRCRGRVDAEAITGLFAQVEGAATLAAPPPLPDAVAALDRGQTLGFSVGLAIDAETTRHAHPEPLRAELEALFGALSELVSTSCERFTVAG